MTTEQTVIIVGAGLAGASAAAELRKGGFDGAIALLGEERHRPYERPGLSKAYLTGQLSREQLDFRSAQFYEDKRVDLRLSSTVKAVDRSSQTVVTADDTRLRYDRLLLATGSDARHLEIPGSYLSGVHYLRTVDDADAIMRKAARGGRVAVIGGGWIGAEVAASLRRLGNPVTMIAPGRAPLEGVLGAEIGALFLELHRENVAAGLEVNDGVVVDEYLRTSDPAVFAAGDVARAWHPRLRTHLRVEHWDNALAQGRTAARNILDHNRAYDRIPYFYSDQFDLSMEYVGYAPRWDRVVYRGDPARRIFIAFWLTDGAVAAAMNVGIPGAIEPLRALIASRAPAHVNRLSDPAVPLEDLVTVVPKPANTARDLVAARAPERSSP
jgi:3-phenylpropionate/trans-cinnamate dioxygenase ferredoxin reductase subunit